MSMPRPGGMRPSSSSSCEFVAITLRAFETFEDVFARAPQFARPVLMDAIDTWDHQSWKFKNGTIMSWNGVILDPTPDPDDPSQWEMKEPYQRLDSEVRYPDGWKRLNNGTFRADSGLSIYPDLTIVHKSGLRVYQDGVCLHPDGRRTTTNPLGVGIIYRPGTSAATGIEYIPMAQPAMDPAVAQSITTVSYHGQRIVPQIPAGPTDNVSVVRRDVQRKYDQLERYPTPHSLVLPRVQGMVRGNAGAYVPPQVRSDGQAFNDGLKIMTLNLEQLRNAVPNDLGNYLDPCDFRDCTQDHFGIPMCVPAAIKLQMIPHIKDALKILNGEP